MQWLCACFGYSKAPVSKPQFVGRVQEQKNSKPLHQDSFDKGGGSQPSVTPRTRKVVVPPLAPPTFGGSPASSKVALLPKSIEIQEKIGDGKSTDSGQQVMVFKGYDSQSKENVAVKVVPLSPFGPVACHERDVMRDLKGVPFVVPYKGYYQDDKFGYLVTGLITGKEMFAYIRDPWSGGIPIDNLRVYLVQIILALEAMHERGVIYRDLKPENILLTEKGVGLIDFDLSKRNMGRLERTYSLKGTPEYFAPEILNREGHDSRVDNYCLGLLLFEMLSGRPRFTIAAKVGKEWDPVKHPRQVWSLPKARDRDEQQAHDLIYRLIRTNPDNRLSLAQALKHPFLAGIDVEKVRSGEIMPPLALPTLEAFSRARLLS